MARADSATQVYTGQPSAPPPGGHSGTLPVTGFEVVVLVFLAAFAVGIGFGLYLKSKGGRK